MKRIDLLPHPAWWAASALVSVAVLVGSAQAAQGRCAWRSIAVPVLKDARFNDVEILAEDDIWVVGEQTDGSRSVTLHYDGTAFTVVPTPSPFRFENSLSAVSAVVPDDIWAVGSGVVKKTPNFVHVPLALHFDGRAWRHVPPPRVRSKFGGSLNTVAAISGNDVWAFGEAERTDQWVGLAQRWNGRRWRAVKVAGAEINAATALSPTSLWVTTSAFEILHWNGQRWRRVTGPNRDATGGLLGISALTDRDVWAVGAYAAGPIAGRFNGRRMRNLPIPYSHFKGNYQARENSEMGDVLAFAHNDVLAVSNFGIEHHDGKQWRKASPIASLTALDALSRDNVWAVGTRYKPGSGSQGVVMHYSCS
jgi:hypothetical protein